MFSLNAASCIDLLCRGPKRLLFGRHCTWFIYLHWIIFGFYVSLPPSAFRLPNESKVIQLCPSNMCIRSLHDRIHPDENMYLYYEPGRIMTTFPYLQICAFQSNIFEPLTKFQTPQPLWPRPRVFNIWVCVTRRSWDNKWKRYIQYPCRAFDCRWQQHAQPQAIQV